MDEKQPTSASLDWLTCTLPQDARRPPQNQAEAILKALPDNDGIEPGNPRPRNYTKALRGRYATVSWHPDHPRMKTCVTLTGDDCRAYYQTGKSADYLIASLWRQDANFTRVDVAVDWYDQADIAALVDKLIEQPGNTLARTIEPYQHYKLAEQVKRYDAGVYIGSRKSDRFLVCYNKALQLDAEVENWFRIELRNRREYANQIATAALHSGIVESGRQIMRTIANPSIGWWQEALVGPVVEVPSVGRKDTDTRAWLIDQVLPVLVRELAKVDDANDPLFKRYNEALNAIRWRLSQGSG